ncbi:MAG: thioredoxin domain-containing protein [bacterium]
MASQRKSQRQPAGRRKVQPVRQKQTLSWRLIAGAAAVVVLAVAGLIVFALSTSNGSESSNALATQIDQSAADLPEQDGFALGSAEAALVLDVYEDFQCPFCVKFTATVEPGLITDYVRSGKVRLVFHNFAILGAESVAAAKGSVCAADQDRAWNFGLALYSLQANADQVGVEKLNVGRFNDGALRKAADRAGLDAGKFQSCINDAATTATVSQQYADGSTLGVRGTPSFALNGTYLANVPSDLAGWKLLLDQALATTAK